MSEADCNVDGTEVLENILITSSKAAVDDHSIAAAELNASAAKEVADRPLHSDPISPATAEPKKGVDLPTDDEPKVILNLEIAKLHRNGNDKNPAEGAKITATEIETVRISNADSSNEIAATKEVFLHNNRIGKPRNSSDEEENFEVVEIIGMPMADMKSSPTRKNPLSDVTNDELLAILEGDVDSTTAKTEEAAGNEADPTVVFKIIVPEEKPDTLDEDDIKKIAMEQMNSIKMKRRGRPGSSAPKASELVSSLVSEWSDTEKDSDQEKPAPKSASTAKETAIIKKRPVAQAVKKPAPVVTPFKPTRIIKKKIIWDPDAPETQVSYASLVKSTVTPRKRQSSAGKSSAGSTPSLSSEPLHHVSLLKPKQNIHVAPVKSKMEHIPLLKSKPDPLPSTTPTTHYQPKMRILNSAKRSSPSPPLIHNKRKRVSEIDKLLNDEGAANMLNTLDTGVKLVVKEPRAKKPPTPVPAKKETTPRKRGPRTSASSSWDYVYNQRNVDSLIIRRRSNSSYSSTTSPRRSSLEAKKPSNSRSTKGKIKSFEFAKPESKKIGKNSPGGASETLLVDDIKKGETRDSLRKSSRTPIPTGGSKDSGTTVTNRPAPETNNAAEVTIQRHGAVVQMVLKPKTGPVENTFTVQLMNEVVRHLNILETDNKCKIVVITSGGPDFCEGVDFLAITQGSAEKRKHAALELAESVTSFLLALLSFPKPLIAGIVGSCSGIGVTMLPLFDIVICSDKSTFEAPYAQMGQLPEGHCILTATNNIRHSFKTKLLWLCEKLSAIEAALAGLVTKLTAPSKVIEETLQHAERAATTLSQQALTSLKSQRHDLKNLTAILKNEKKILASQWLTTECQDKFKQFIANGHW